MKTQIFQHRKWYAVVLFMLILSITNAWGADVTYVFKDATNNPGSGNNWSSDNIDTYSSWSATKGGSNDPKYYSTGTGLRVYNGGKFTISSSKTISSITLTFSGTGYTFSSSNTTTPLTVSPNATSYEWSVYRTCRLQKIEITYAASCSNKVTISKGTESHGTFTLDKTGEQDACSALSVTVTPSPADHYHVASVSATNPATTGTAGTAVDNGDGTWTITYSANAKGASTVNVTFEADLQYTVNWYVNGSVAHSQTGYEGATLTSIPTPTSIDCDGSKVFVGWYTSTYSHASTAPAYVSPTTIPNGGANYYAVFATASGGASTWDKVTTLAGITAGTYVIINNSKYLPSTNTSSAPTQGTAPTITGTQITGTVTDAMKWYFTSTGTANQFYIQNEDDDYLYETNANNGLRVGSTSDKWTFAANTLPAFSLQGNNNSRYCATYASGSDWRSYTSATAGNYGDGGKVYLYKLTGGVSYSNFETTCCTPLGQINGSINLTHTETSSSVTVTVGTRYTDYNKVSGYIFKIYDAASAGNLLNTLETNSNSAADRSQTFTGLTASTNYWVTVTAKGDGSTYCATSKESARVQVTTSAAACVDQFSLHTGTQGGSDWVYNKCFSDANWGAADDAIWVGEFPSTNECYVGYAGSNSYHGAYWAVGGIKTYNIPNGRTLGWNGSDYYSDYPAMALGTFHIYKNSTDANYYLRFKPTSYVLRTGSDGTSWTSRDMTVSGVNANYYESDFVTLTSTLISEHAYVDLKANNGNGHVWCNFSNDRTASGNVKVKNGASTFRATDLQASDNGTYGKFQIDITQDVDNWKLAFVPYFHITYNANGGTGSTEASSYVEVGSTASAAANGFTAPAHTSFGGWATSAANAAAGTVAYAAGADITLTADVELFAIWTPEANATITLNNYTGSATTTGYYAGDSFTLPSTNNFSCNDKTFVGWSTVVIANSSTKPASNFYEPGASVTLGATNTFYAVFAEVEESEVLSEDFSSIEIGNSTSNSGSSSAWTANSNFGELSAVYQAGGAIRVGKSGLVTTKSLNLSGGDVIVAFKMKGWSDSEKTVSVQIDNGSATAVTCSNSMSGDFEVKSVTLSGGTSSSVVKFTTSSNVRVFLDDISITAGSSSAYSTNCVACNEVTVSYTAPSDGNAMTVKKGSTTINNNDAVKTCSAVDLTVTLTPAAHFTADDLTATGVTGVTVSNVGNVYTVSIPADKTGTLTLTPTFTAETPLTITFSVPTGMGTAGTIGTIYSGDNFDFPNVTGYDSDCVDFIGWVDATSGSTFHNDGTATSEPMGLFKYNDNSGAVSTNKTYKAVYGEKVTDYAESYAKVTSAPANWANDHYLIVYEAGNLAFDGSLNTLDAVSNNVAVTITAGTIPYSTTLAASEFRIAAITGGYSIQSASGKYIGTSSDANSLESSTEAILNTLSISDGNFDAVSNSAHLRYNAAANQTRFRYYKSSSYTSQQAVQLYKYGMNEVVTYTYTTAPACGDKYFVTLASVTGGAPTASPKAAADGTTINIVANPNNGYTFTGWTITKTTGGDNVTSTLLGANSATASISFTMPAYNVTVTAAYSITDYTITYNNLNGASNTNPTNYTVATADINLADPGERSGYVFKGWYDDAVYTNRVQTIANGSTGNISLYAKWAVGYTVTWQNGVGATNPTPTGIEDGQAVGTLPVPTGSCELNGVEYSNFVGWYTGTIADVATDPSEAGTLITSATVPNGNVTYHAVYTNMPDYSSTHTSNVTLPSQSGVIYTAKVKVDDADDAPQYDAIKIGSNSTKTSSFNFTVPSGTTRITVQGAGWSGKTTSITLATTVGTISPSTAQPLEAQSGASNNSPFTITSNTTLTFNLTGVTSEATITLSNSGERVVVWGINASSASGSEIGYITQCCDNMLSAPVMNTPTVRTSTAVTLSWNAVANASGYKVSWNGGDWEDVGNTTTYAKTSLEPETDYAYRVIAKYSTPYCGATPVEGVVSTKPVYTVTYAKGTGTGSCSATGTVPAVATYEAGQVVTIVANPFTLAGNTFAAWVVKDASDNTVAVTNGQFTMPESNVTITATWTAKQDRFFDRMHDGTDATHGGVDDGNGHYYIVRGGCQYLMPTLTDDDTGTDICHTSHYKLLGWVAESHINTTDGTIKAEALDANGMVKDNLLYKPGVSVMTANNQTFYAVWAVVQ